MAITTREKKGSATEGHREPEKDGSFACAGPGLSNRNVAHLRRARSLIRVFVWAETVCSRATPWIRVMIETAGPFRDVLEPGTNIRGSPLANGFPAKVSQNELPERCKRTPRSARLAFDAQRSAARQLSTNNSPSAGWRG